MSVQDDIIYYYRRAAEARARGRDDLAQSMENYARNLEAGIYNDDGRGFDISASNKRWADKEAAQRKQMTSCRQMAKKVSRDGIGNGGITYAFMSSKGNYDN